MEKVVRSMVVHVKICWSLSFWKPSHVMRLTSELVHLDALGNSIIPHHLFVFVHSYPIIFFLLHVILISQNAF